LPGATASAWPFGADPSFLMLYWPGLLTLGLYVLSMLLYQRLLAPGTGGDQAKQMAMNSKLMTLVFVGLFLFFPVGLILVWLAFNLLSIAQHVHITKILDRKDAAAALATAGAGDASPPAPAAKAAAEDKPRKKGKKRRKKG
ncbi:hypothetical protein IIA16_01750, partial [bacterium]|nr:hypothetical protein [bacterium]